MNQALYDLLVDRLRTVPNLPPLQTENTNIDPAGKAFSRATLIRTRPTQLSLGTTGQDLHSGLLQVDLYVPVGAGTSIPNTVADAVIAAFPRGLTLTAEDIRVHVRQSYRETGGRGLNDKFHAVPVAIEWSTSRPAA